MNSELKNTLESIQNALFSLRASGPEGFEGLIRDAYREATGVSLRLQKSGAQHGVDAAPDDLNGDIATGIEAKRYQQTTSLPMDELKSKLIDAVTRESNPVELWILAASKEVSGDDVAELCRIGDQHGLGVLVLDWRSDVDATAPLPLLLTLAPSAVRQYLGDTIADALPTLVEHPEYAAQKDKFLKRLVGPDLGLSHAAKATKDKISDTLRSRANARSQLQNPVDMEAPSRIWAPRDSHCKAIQEWKAEAANVPVCAAIGEEGAGKTWLMFDWWRRETNNDNPPLIVWLSARDVASGSIADVIGAALKKWISEPKRDAAFWSRRVELWRRIHGLGGEAPFAWLMLDGVNEGTSQENVLRVLNEAVASEWMGNVGVLLSGRPTHWAQRFLAGKSLEVPPTVINVKQFSEPELDVLLTRHGKTRDNFSPEVLRIIHWPRWFAVAATLFDKEHDWSAHSPEHLMIKYWQHHLLERGRITDVNDEMFRDFVSRLGAEMTTDLEAEKTVSRAKLKELLSGHSGSPEKDLLEAVNDVTSGIWMQPNGAHQFSLDEAILPFAISLALLNEMRFSTTGEEADSECEKFLGPIEHQDIGVDTLGAAISLSFIESDFPDHAKKTLIKRWVDAHNFSRRHFELLWRIASASPDAFFAVAEDLWLQDASGHSIDEILVKCIANIANDGDRMSNVISFMAKWAGTYWLDPHLGQFIGYNPADKESAAAKRATEERLEQLRADLGDKVFMQTGLECCENGAGASRLSQRIFAIATYLPRAKQQSVWRGWVLSRSVMGNTRHYDDLAWSLRLNTDDGPEAAQALIRTVDELLALNSQIVRPQILSLLKAYGGREAADKLSAIGETFQTRKRFDGKVEVVNNLVVVSDEKERRDRDIAILLSQFARIPEIKISGDLTRRLEQFAQGFSVNELSRGRGQTSANNDLDQAEPALAHWTPEALANLYRRILATIGMREEQGLVRLVLSVEPMLERWAPEALVKLYRRLLAIIGKPEEQGLLGRTLFLDGLLVLIPEKIQQQITAALIERTSVGDGPELDQISWSLLNAAVFDRTVAAQRDIWEKIGAPEKVPQELEHLIRPIPMEMLRSLESELHPGRERGRLISWLGYLLCSATRELPKNWETLWRLFDHEDGTVRFLAFNIALVGNDTDLASRLYQTGWEASSELSVMENCGGSNLLCLAATDLAP